MTAVDPYDALPGMRWTRLSRMRRSPLHFRRGGEPDTDALVVGRAIHSLVLGGPPVVVFEDTRRGKTWESYRDEHADAIILYPRQQRAVVDCAAAVLRDPSASALLAGTEREVAITWTQDGRPCKCRIDAMGGTLIIDLKTTRDASPHAFARAAAGYRYAHQLAWYRRGHRSRYPDTVPDCYLIAAENAEPYDVAVYAVEDTDIDLADREVSDLWARYIDCVERDEWPGCSPEPDTLRLPEWAFSDDDGAPLTMGGESVEVE